MAITPLQTTVSRLDKSLRSEDKDVCRRVVDKARPYIAIRQSNKVTVCMCCGNSMVYSGNERFVKCCECGRTVEIIEEEAWLSSKRSVQKYFATVDVVEGIQLMRIYDVAPGFGNQPAERCLCSRTLPPLDHSGRSMRGHFQATLHGHIYHSVQVDETTAEIH